MGLNGKSEFVAKLGVKNYLVSLFRAKAPVSISFTPMWLFVVAVLVVANCGGANGLQAGTSPSEDTDLSSSQKSQNVHPVAGSTSREQTGHPAQNSHGKELSLTSGEISHQLGAADMSHHERRPQGVGQGDVKSDDQEGLASSLLSSSTSSDEDVSPKGLSDNASKINARLGTTKSSKHHVKRRSFEFSNRLRGMDQNFLGPLETRASAKPPSYYFGRGGIYNQKRALADFDGVIDDDDESLIRAQRGFDSISGGRGISGMHQNFLDKKRWGNGEVSGYWIQSPSYLSKRSFDSIGMGRLSGLHQNHLERRGFDSISGGRINGLNQNFINKKRSFDSIGSNLIGGLNQNYINKRFDSISSGSMSGINANHFQKKFDSISGGRLSGLNQNYLGKRSFDSISEAGGLRGMKQRFLGKRGFDSIDGSSGLSSFNQNFLDKRFLDSISHNLMSGMRQNYVDKKSFDSLSRDLMAGMRQNHLHKKNFDPLSRGTMSGMKQNHLSKKSFDTLSSSDMGGLGQNFINKRSFDSISGNSGIGGMGQNFIGSKRFDSIGGGVMGGIGQNFLGKKYYNKLLTGSPDNYAEKRFDSFSRGPIGGMNQNFVSKRSLDSTRGLRQNFANKKRFDSISTGTLGGLHQNFVEKRDFDTLSSSSMGGFGNNFQEKRQFDSISGSRMGGIGQNFIHKRFDSISSGSPLSGMGQNFLDRRSTTYRPERFTVGFRRHFIDKRSLNNSPRMTDYGVDATSGSRHTRFAKRHFDSISGYSGIGGLNQNHLNPYKRLFDTVSSHSPNEEIPQRIAASDSGYTKKFGQGQVYYDSGYNKQGHMSSRANLQAEADKRSFDSIDGFSSMSGMGQNFIGPTKRRRYDYAAFAKTENALPENHSLLRSTGSNDLDYHPTTSETEFNNLVKGVKLSNDDKVKVEMKSENAEELEDSNNFEQTEAAQEVPYENARAGLEVGLTEDSDADSNRERTQSSEIVTDPESQNTKNSAD